MKNTHIEHPEDSILNGDLSVLDWFTSNGKISAKIDGAPAIVWGTNPANGKFFVGTKSVFNKIKIKINHDHSEIERNHQGKVATILHHCLDYLPATTGIYQGDFIGFGGTDSYLPNTIRYYFPQIVTQKIIIAPHTEYIVPEFGYTGQEKGQLKHAVAQPITKPFRMYHKDWDVLFVKPWVTIDEHRDDIKDMCNFARQMSTLCEFPNDKQVKRVKQHLNACIRADIEMDDITLEALAHDNEIDVNVLRLWKLVETIKMDMFAYIDSDDSLECYIGEERCDHEGYVLVNEFGTYKIVNREGFSHANFNIGLMSRKGDA